MPEIIRPMTEADIAPVADLLFRSFNLAATQNGLPLKIVNPDTAKAWVWSLMHNKSTVKRVADADGHITGITCLNPRGKIAGLGPTAVDPDTRQVLRRKPTVIALMDEIMQIGESVESIRCFLECFNTIAYNISYSFGLMPVETMHHFTLTKTMRDKTPPSDKISQASLRDLEEILAYDAPQSLLDRRDDFATLYLRWGRVFVHRVDSRITGYLVSLPGKEFVQLGPLLADSQEVAVELFRKAILSFENRPFQTRVMSRDILLHYALKEWRFKLESLDFLLVRGPWKPGKAIEAFGMFPEAV